MMRKVLLILALIIPTFVKAQSLQTDTTKPKEVYCMVIATGKLFSNKVSIQVDYGQATSFWSGGHGEAVKDEAGKLLNFNSVIDALNYMASKGWVFVNAYALSEASSGRVLNYVMRKPLP